MQRNKSSRVCGSFTGGGKAMRRQRGRWEAEIEKKLSLKKISEKESHDHRAETAHNRRDVPPFDLLFLRLL